MPTVSVIMPVYNGAGYLQAAVTSILGQSFSDFEFIIVDDGSRDRTGEILRAAAASDTRIRVVSQENRGIAPSLNTGLALATGDLVARMDADDIALPHRFEQQVAFLRDHPECGLVGGQILFTDPDDRPLMRLVHPLNHAEMVSVMMGGSASLAHPTVMFRRALAQEIGGYSLDFEHAEDIDFFLRLSERAEIANLPDVVLRYRQHWASIGFTKAKAQAASHSRAVAEAARRNGAPVPAPIEISVQGDLEDVYRRWAWWALGDRNLGSARHYARKALLRRPLDQQNWRLMICAIRGY